MQQAIEDGRGQNGVVEGLTPIQEAFVAGNDHAGAFVTAHDQTEEQVSFLLGQGQVADFVDDQQFGVGELLEILRSRRFSFNARTRRVIKVSRVMKRTE